MDPGRTGIGFVSHGGVVGRPKTACFRHIDSTSTLALVTSYPHPRLPSRVALHRDNLFTQVCRDDLPGYSITAGRRKPASRISKDKEGSDDRSVDTLPRERLRDSGKGHSDEPAESDAVAAGHPHAWPPITQYPLVRGCFNDGTPELPMGMNVSFACLLGFVLLGEVVANAFSVELNRIRIILAAPIPSVEDHDGQALRLLSAYSGSL